MIFGPQRLKNQPRNSKLIYFYFQNCLGSEKQAPFDLIHSLVKLSNCSNWNCRQSASMIALIEAWRGVIPNWILNSVVEQLVMPRLEQEVDNWNPLTDMVPVHQWIHPWIPYAKDRLITMVYPTIRRKLSAALTAWHPSDKSALLMLKPWKQAFPQGDMDAFLMTNILPKLQNAIQELVINPHQQHLGNFMLKIRRFGLMVEFDKFWKEKLMVL